MTGSRRMKQSTNHILVVQAETNDLRDSINDLRRPNFEHRYYIPEQLLFDLVSEELIRGVLVESCLFQLYEVEDLTKAIHGGARKIFSILVLNSHFQYIKKFIEDDQLQTSQLDYKLPFDLSRLGKFMRESHARIFYEKQWEFTAPVFSESVLRRHLADETILPFISEETIGHGGFGIVHRVELDSEQNLYGPTYQKVPYFRNRLSAVAESVH